MSYAVTEEAVSALESMGAELDELTEAIRMINGSLRSAFEENEAGLGAHSADILTLIEDVEATTEEANGPVKKLVLKLRRAAMIRRKHIEERRYGRSR